MYSITTREDTKRIIIRFIHLYNLLSQQRRYGHTHTHVISCIKPWISTKSSIFLPQILVFFSTFLTQILFFFCLFLVKNSIISSIPCIVKRAYMHLIPLQLFLFIFKKSKRTSRKYAHKYIHFYLHIIQNYI